MIMRMKEDKPNSLLIPDWSVPSNVRAWVTSRHGIDGNNLHDTSPFGAFNLAFNVGDSIDNVILNRNALLSELGVERIQWLKQTHSADVIEISEEIANDSPQADAIYCREKGVACGILTADCLPVIFCSVDGREVAVAHAGWRGLANGILQNTLKKFRAPPEDISAWMGPAIGPCHFQVGNEVKEKFNSIQSNLDNCFEPSIRPGHEKESHWQADLFKLARKILTNYGIEKMSGGGICTYCQHRQFYSFRFFNELGHQTGRFATLICLK